MKYLQNALVLLLVYLPPLLMFIRVLRRKNVNIFLLAVIGSVYIGVTLFAGTQNLIPFIFVLLNIRLMRTSRGYDSLIDNDNYIKFRFNIKGFKILSALKYSGISYAITFTLSMILSIILYVSKMNLEQQQIVTELMKVPLGKFLFMVPMMIIFAPILEEFIFRWFLFEGILSKRVGLYAGAVISSMIFALVHFNIKALVIIFALGLINCYLIHKKGFWYAVFNHSVFNSVTAVAMLLQKIMG